MQKNKKQKKLGQVFTPKYIVEQILDEIGYVSGHILNKKIIEPAFGDGAFLECITARLLQECLLHGYSKDEIKKELENNIYGIEIDENVFQAARTKLDNIVAAFQVENVNWKLFCQDALDWEQWHSFDYVVGNPPYVRIHHLSEKSREKIKSWTFSKGTTDLYVIFFELGIKLLNNTGKLGYITPNSYITNTSQGMFRKYLLEQNLIEKIKDFRAWKVFPVDTYTAITILNMSKSTDMFTYAAMQENKCLYSTQYFLSDFKDTNGDFSQSLWTLTSQTDKRFLQEIKENDLPISSLVTVQYGFATNADSVYICNSVQEIQGEPDYVLFHDRKIEKEAIQSIVKGSTYHGKEQNQYIIFPYYENKKGKIVPYQEEELKEKYPLAYLYLLENKERLLKRDMEKNAQWFQFARSQGLVNCRKKKLIVNPLLNPEQKQAEVYMLPENVLVYSGIYITENQDNILEKTKTELQSEQFYRYAFLNGKDMSGGWKSFNTKTIKSYKISGILIKTVSSKSEGEKEKRTYDALKNTT